MARRLAKQIGQDIEQLRWLWWQTIRRHEKYRDGVAALLRCWRKTRSEMTQLAEDKNRALVVPKKSGGWTLTAGFFRLQGRSRAIRRALTAYRRARTFNCRDVPPDGQTGRLPAKFFLVEVELTSIIQSGLTSRYYTAPHNGRRAASSLKLKSTKEDALPELTRFSRRWGLQFPIPPSVALPLEELMTSAWCRPVEIERGNGESLTLILHLSAGREIVLAFTEGALHHFSQKRKRGGKMAWKMVSRKRDVKHDVRIVALSKQRFRVTIALPANAKDVRAALASNLPRSTAKWRSREDYETVFAVIDSLNTRLPRPFTPSGRSKVWDSQRAFQSLVRIFRLRR